MTQLQLKRLAERMEPRLERDLARLNTAVDAYTSAREAVHIAGQDLADLLAVNAAYVKAWEESYDPESGRELMSVLERYSGDVAQAYQRAGWKVPATLVEYFQKRREW